MVGPMGPLVADLAVGVILGAGAAATIGFGAALMAHSLGTRRRVKVRPLRTPNFLPLHPTHTYLRHLPSRPPSLLHLNCKNLDVLDPAMNLHSLIGMSPSSLHSVHNPHSTNDHHIEVVQP